MEAPAGRQGKANESLPWLPWIPGCVSVLGSGREMNTPLCCVKLCSRSAFCFCSEVFICVIAAEGSLGGAGRRPGLPSPNNCRRSHRENFPCVVKRCRAQGRARTRVCARCAPLPRAHLAPRESGAPWGAQEQPPEQWGVWGLTGGSCGSPRHPVTHRGAVVHTHELTLTSHPHPQLPLTPPTHRETPLNTFVPACTHTTLHAPHPHSPQNTPPPHPTYPPDPHAHEPALSDSPRPMSPQPVPPGPCPPALPPFSTADRSRPRSHHVAPPPL